MTLKQIQNEKEKKITVELKKNMPLNNQHMVTKENTFLAFYMASSRKKKKEQYLTSWSRTQPWQKQIKANSNLHSTKCLWCLPFQQWWDGGQEPTLLKTPVLFLNSDQMVERYFTNHLSECWMLFCCSQQHNPQNTQVQKIGTHLKRLPLLSPHLLHRNSNMCLL